MNGVQNPPRVACLLGATGLVGGSILQQLLSDPRFSKVHILVRRSPGVVHSKLVEHVINFDAAESFQQLVGGDVLFSALGTSIKAAGSRAEQYKVDYTYQLYAAEAARRNGASTYVLVSSPWAQSRSRTFYRRMKGDLERDVEALRFPRTRFVRPGPLNGDRSEDGVGEKLRLSLLRSFAPLLPSVIRPTDPATVARAAITAAFDSTPGTLRYDPRDVSRVGAEASSPAS